MSEGNAHPYSWSAIINGYFDGNEISEIGFPAVAGYLKANQQTLGIDGVDVTHVWTQDRSTSESIARVARIGHVVSRAEEMIDQVDAIILARDDAKNHLSMAKPFIEAGIPVFIDKPLAVTKEDLEYFAHQDAKGKLIMSCSSLRYSNECLTAKQDLQSLGKLELVTAVGKKDWIKYGVHLLEGIFMLLDDPDPVSVKHIGKEGKDIVHVQIENNIQVVVYLFMDIVPVSQISLFGQEGWKTIEIKNSYSMFRDNILEFIRSVREGRSRIPFNTTEKIIRTLIAAKESLEQDGKTIYLDNRTNNY